MKRFLQRFYVFIIFLFLYAPIFVLMAYSFNSSRSRGAWGGFTLKWYRELFRDRTIMMSLKYTIIIAILAAIISTIIGTASAIGISRMKKIPRSIMMNISYLPVLNPDIITGVSLMILFIFLKMNFGFWTMLIAHITFNIPYVILSVMPKIKQLDPNIYEAALDLGASPTYAFWRVIIPQLMPGIVTGFMLAFTLSIDDFVISFFTTGVGVPNLSITVFSMARRGVNPKINALSTLMFLSVLILLIVVNIRMSRDVKSKKQKEGIII